jgi:hypothetical protein
MRLVVVLGPALVLAAPIVVQLFHPDGGFTRLHGWFDPLFVHFNLMVLTAATLFIPFLALTYLVTMKGERRRRLLNELGGDFNGTLETRIDGYLASQFEPAHYVASVAAMMAVVAFGGTILLLVKPVAANPAQGLMLSRGANLLLVGPFLEEIAPVEHIQHSLLAIAFGFLGAYLYSITQLIRAYFTVDLTPNTFVAATARIVSASALTLVIAFSFEFLPLGKVGAEGHELSLGLLPIFGFFFGYFPDRALVGIERIAGRAFGRFLGENKYESTALNQIKGMNLTHAARLEREGIDNMENLAASEALEIAVRTSFPLRQVETWVEEAWLRVHLGEEDYDKVSCAGVTTRQQLRQVAQRWSGPVSFFDALAEVSGVNRTKIEMVYLLSEARVVPRHARETAAATEPRIAIRRESAPSLQMS